MICKHMAFPLLFGFILVSSVVKIECALWQLCSQLDFYGSGSEYFDCLKFDGYGCWCGPGGSGTPVDGIDDCCMHHDHCYDRVLARHCDPYLRVYKWSKGVCLDPEGSCTRQTCDCDQAISKCTSAKKYNRRYFDWRLWHWCDRSTHKNWTKRILQKINNNEKKVGRKNDVG